MFDIVTADEHHASASVDRSGLDHCHPPRRTFARIAATQPFEHVYVLARTGQKAALTHNNPLNNFAAA
jgi:hypothetical protein